jgi:GNAT superfamily N-acetyltransferase/N-acetylglutamate synthase-like GNAT family acetyltransferase
MASSFNIDIATIHDLESIMSLVSTQYSHPYNSDSFWRWRYFENPVADVDIYVTRQSNGSIVAMQVVTAFQTIQNGKGNQAYLFTAAITHPNYRRLGLFRNLVNHIVSKLSNLAQTVPLIYTFPNELSVKGFQKFSDWQQRELLRLYVRPIPTLRNTGPQQILQTLFTEQSFRPQQIGSFLVSRVSRITDSGSLFNRSLTSQGVAIRRDAAYLEWRYCTNPISKYLIFEAHHGGEVCGYIVMKLIDFRGIVAGLVVDLVAATEASAAALINQVIRTAYRYGIKMLGYLVGCHNPYHDCFLKKGFIPIPQKLLPRHFYLYTCAPHGKIPSLTRDAPWYITWGDTDVV